MKVFVVFASLCCSVVQAEMNEMNDTELQRSSGQSGITLSAKVDFEEGTRISYTNEDANYLDQQEYWLVIDNITGSIEMKGLKIDIVDDFGPAANKGAIQWTMPDEITFDNFRTDGIYMSETKDVSNDARFLMAVEVDGHLQLPAQTTMTIFAVQ